MQVAMSQSNLAGRWALSTATFNVAPLDGAKRLMPINFVLVGIYALQCRAPCRGDESLRVGGQAYQESRLQCRAPGRGDVTVGLAKVLGEVDIPSMSRPWTGRCDPRCGLRSATPAFLQCRAPGRGDVTPPAQCLVLRRFSLEFARTCNISAAKPLDSDVVMAINSNFQRLACCANPPSFA